MSTTIYSKQFDFELWSNTMILNSLKQVQEPQPRALFLLSHIINSHCMWICRLKGQPLSCTIFQERSFEECAQQMQQNHKDWMAYLETITEEALHRIIYFDATWEGTKRKMRIEDALIHLINHSSYHRGQIVASIKGKLDPLPLSTYIMYASEIV
jgi:uncharacterized damage-inducible protein DinB